MPGDSAKPSLPLAAAPGDSEAGPTSPQSMAIRASPFFIWSMAVCRPALGLARRASFSHLEIPSLNPGVVTSGDMSGLNRNRPLGRPWLRFTSAGITV